MVIDVGGLIAVVIILIVVGFLLWLLNTKLPLDATIKAIINFVVVLAVVLWLLDAFGVLHLGLVHPIHAR